MKNLWTISILILCLALACEDKETAPAPEPETSITGEWKIDSQWAGRTITYRNHDTETIECTFKEFNGERCCAGHCRCRDYSGTTKTNIVLNENQTGSLIIHQMCYYDDISSDFTWELNEDTLIITFQSGEVQRWTVITMEDNFLSLSFDIENDDPEATYEDRFNPRVHEITKYIYTYDRL